MDNNENIVPSDSKSGQNSFNDKDKEQSSDR